jgi:hypothetical protein
MGKRVLLLGLRPDLVAEFRRELEGEALEVVAGSTLADLRAVFDAGDVDHVILGGGLDIATRSSAVQVIFERSDRATVHLKDQMSGPEGFVPFAVALMRGLSGYEPHLSPQAVLRAQGPR